MDHPKLQFANLLLEQGRFDLALRKIEEYLADEPDSAEGHFVRALCLIRKRDRKGIAAAEHARELAPDEDRAHYVCALAELMDGRVNDSEQSILRAIEINSFVPGYFATLATVRGEQFRWADSLAAADQGLEIDPDDDACLNQRAQALVKLGRKDEAEATLAGTLERNPEDAYTHANQGWTQLNRKRPHDAIVHFREALRLNPESDWAKEGLLESMRARNWFYRQLLAYFLWVSKFSLQTQIILIVALWLSLQGVIKLGQAYPLLSPVILVTVLSYLAFVLSSWFGKHLMNAFLMFDKDGRILLSKGDVICSLIAVVMFVACLVVTAGMVWTDDEIWAVTFRLTVLSAIHFVSCLRLPGGRPRWIGIGASVILLLGIIKLSADHWKWISDKQQLIEISDWLDDPQNENHPDRWKKNVILQFGYKEFKAARDRLGQYDNFLSFASIGVLILHSVLITRSQRIVFVE